MPGTSGNVFAFSEKAAAPETKTLTGTVAGSGTKMVRQGAQQKATAKDTERTDFTTSRPQIPLPNERDE